ncbi:TPA: hypothetical protein ACGWRW_001696 [Streptococcus agalactiae]
MASGEKAKIQRKKSGAWSMTYKTLDGNVVATFRPMFKKQVPIAISQLQK